MGRVRVIVAPRQPESAEAPNECADHAQHGNLLDPRGSESAEAPIGCIDLADHPQHGNLLYRRQSDVARLLGVPPSVFCLWYRRQHPRRRWPARQYAALFRRMQCVYAAHQAGRLSREAALPRMRCLDTEMRLLLRGPVPLRME